MGNRFMLWLLRSPLHRLISGSILALRVTGVRSGRKYDVPVNYVEIKGPEGSRYLITSQRDRTWWRNLREGSDVELVLRGKRQMAKAQALESPEQVAAGLSEYFQAAPGSARFFGIKSVAGEEIPQVELERAASERVVIRIDPSRPLPG